jgi:tRNA pseudouridine synthase 10
MEDKNKKILFELMELTEGKICNHCLGRKFSNIIEANGNVERGEKIREKFQLEDLKADEECDICKNLFEHIDKTLVRKVEAKIEYLNLEYETFLVGSKLESDIIERDEYLNKRLDIEVEPIKKEVNRIILYSLKEGIISLFEEFLRQNGLVDIVKVKVVKNVRVLENNTLNL